MATSNGWIEEIRSRLDRTWPERPTPAEWLPSDTVPRPAAVLIPLYVRERELWTLFTKRTDQVEHHKGQISFPGGVRESGDETLWDTAIREAEEEIGLPRSSVRILGQLPKLLTVTSFEVWPFVGAMPYPIELEPQADEVDAILEIPVTYLMNPEVVEERPVKWKGQEVTTLVYHYRGHAIWGATARILSDLLEALGTDPRRPST